MPNGSISVREALGSVLNRLGTPAIAVSGGVDSLTLAAFACSRLSDVALFHAISPAVPASATLRVERLAQSRGWHLTLVEAGEFEDIRYVSNPVNRCFHCKTNLYATIRAHTARTILSGANLDDLAEYRPGLDAARNHNVCHPFIEASMDKQSVRTLARELGLPDVAALPSSPCLSSRVETGIRIQPEVLAFIHDVELTVGSRLRADTIRCRIRAATIAIELDERTFSTLTRPLTDELTELVGDRPSSLRGLPVVYEQYRNGSAFLVKST